MVVARKTPVAPAPPASRTNSSQVLPRAAKTKAPPNTPVPPVELKSQPVPGKRNPDRAKPSFSRRLFLLLLSIFTVYSFSICRSDFPRTSPICHSLDTYRTYVLEPYILPPLHLLLQRTEPHLAPLKPYVAPLQPYAASTIRFSETHVIPRISAATSFVLSQYSTHVAPRVRWFFIDQYWNGIIKPIYFQGIHPTLELHTRPYRLYYQRFVVPSTRKAYIYAEETLVHLRPHAVYYYTIGKKYACVAYATAKPHVYAAYASVRPHAVLLLEKGKVQALLLAGKAADARREFVDPHVRRIWDKVVEKGGLSTGTTVAPVPTAVKIQKAVPTQVSAEEATPIAHSVVAESVPVSISASSSASASVNPPEPEPEPAVQETTSSSITSYIAPKFSSVSLAASSSSAVQEPAETTSSLPPLTVSPSASPSLNSLSVSPVPTTEVASASAESIVAASLHITAAPTEESADTDTDDDNVDDFLKDLGVELEIETEPVVDIDDTIEVEFPETDATTTTENAIPHTPAPPVDRKQQTADKRAALTVRHLKWQEELDALVRAHTKGVRDVLHDIRKDAVKQLAAWGESKDGGHSGKDGKRRRGVAELVEEEAARLVRGVEGYIKGVEERGLQGLNAVDIRREKEKWEKVLEKVDERFAEKVQEIQGEVHEWFVKIRTREVEEIDSAAETVKAFADRAQSDIGLDYAWLDDVTYYDWQKYHDLMRTSENFTKLAQTIQAAVDPKGTNILIDALNDLEAHVSETTEGFGVLLSGVRRRAGGVFADAEAELKANAEAKKAQEDKEKQDEKVSILPVEPVVPVQTDAPAHIGVEDVLLGRAKEEVEAKLRDVPVVQAGREEL